jgi:hypothetical protein
MVIYTWWCWYICKRRESLSSREGFRVLSPSCRACEVRFGALVGMKHLFSFAPEARKGGEVAGVFLALDAGYGSIGH